jgi:hypothetical protein
VTHLGWALPVVVILCAGISLPKIVREIYRMRQTQFYATYDGGQWKDYVQVGAYLGERGRPATDRFLAWLNQGALSYLSGLRSPPEPLRGIFPPFPRPDPAFFVNLAVQSGCRFVVVADEVGQLSAADPRMEKDDPQEWNEEVQRLLVATNLYSAPATRLGRFLVFERFAPPASGEDPPPGR